MSELSFLLDLLLNRKLSRDVKALIAERIRLIETRQLGPIVAPRAAAINQQAPSTLANLEKADVMQMAPPAAARIVGGTVDNGDGTKGKRKW